MSKAVFFFITGGLLMSKEVKLQVYRRPGGDKVYAVFDNQLPAALKKVTV
ncbi:hypothetical protein HanXRQr2_Chr07g0283041 [Helianthus annuus]|uniref:Uncharacterized protein n=1 Tax=Helianthus annuus TaxID=4232 RepID=A0A9K3IJ26_HELAN|nr:hypothetical protein HanXRQr2_Chr07g0283041 [Helianthus annuus]KAJ0903776.1 hypothetical protein HanPSC8_Chr07g0273871 [Helianthus annuus]